MNNSKRSANRGVTLVEIAIVLVIIGLLLGGVLKGQELINNAKVRSMADRQNSLKVAWFSFIDRYQALPGDYILADRHIPGAGPGEGNGFLLEGESVLVLSHLTGAGYLRCSQCTATESEAPTARNSLQNQYGGVMAIFHDSEHYAAIGGNGKRPRLYIHTGPLIPSNIVGEVDRKIDDGLANTGDMVFNEYSAKAQSQDVDEEKCMATATTGSGGTKSATAAVGWRWASAKPPIEQSCGASVII